MRGVGGSRLFQLVRRQARPRELGRQRFLPLATPTRPLSHHVHTRTTPQAPSDPPPPAVPSCAKCGAPLADAPRGYVCVEGRRAGRTHDHAHGFTPHLTPRAPHPFPLFFAHSCVDGRIAGGIGAVPGFGWWPIKAYRPCPALEASGRGYTR